MTQPCSPQNRCSVRIRSWKVTGGPTIVQNSVKRGKKDSERTRNRVRLSRNLLSDQGVVTTFLKDGSGTYDAVIKAIFHRILLPLLTRSGALLYCQKS